MTSAAHDTNSPFYLDYVALLRELHLLTPAAARMGLTIATCLVMPHELFDARTCVVSGSRLRVGGQHAREVELPTSAATLLAGATGWLATFVGPMTSTLDIELLTLDNPLLPCAQAVYGVAIQGVADMAHATGQLEDFAAFAFGAARAIGSSSATGAGPGAGNGTVQLIDSAMRRAGWHVPGPDAAHR